LANTASVQSTSWRGNMCWIPVHAVPAGPQLAAATVRYAHRVLSLAVKAAVLVDTARSTDWTAPSRVSRLWAWRNNRLPCVAEPSFTLVQLRYFAAAAEHGSMTAAARTLMVSQSAVSTAVAQLEKELGVQLLLRHHARGLTLTEAGRGFYQELRGFLLHSSELAESARRAGQALVVDLAVGCFITLAPFRLPSLLAAYHGRFPDVRVTMIEGEHARLKRALRSGECELALMYGYDLNEDIDRITVDAVPPYALVSAEHKLAGRTPPEIGLAELDGEPMVLLDLPHSASYLESVLRGAGVEPVVRAPHRRLRNGARAGGAWARVRAAQPAADTRPDL
jgi:DNA-binding transcriptional LysR family regulator